MAQFDPPQRHWDDDFDRRLASTFQWLKDEVESLSAQVAALQAKDRLRDSELAQAVADAKFYSERAAG